MRWCSARIYKPAPVIAKTCRGALKVLAPSPPFWARQLEKISRAITRARFRSRSVGGRPFTLRAIVTLVWRRSRNDVVRTNLVPKRVPAHLT